MTTSTDILILDVESTGLDPTVHRVWEVAMLTPDGASDVFQIELDEFAMHHADPVAMEINGWAERYDPALHITISAAVQRIAAATMGKIVVGKNPAFDITMMLASFRIEGPLPWHYRQICVDQIAYGALVSRGVEVNLPWKSDELAEKLGVSVPDDQRHTALGDCLLAKGVWDAVHAMGAA